MGLPECIRGIAKWYENRWQGATPFIQTMYNPTNNHIIYVSNGFSPHKKPWLPDFILLKYVEVIWQIPKFAPSLSPGLQLRFVWKVYGCNASLDGCRTECPYGLVQVMFIWYVIGINIYKPIWRFWRCQYLIYSYFVHTYFIYFYMIWSPSAAWVTGHHGHWRSVGICESSRFSGNSQHPGAIWDES
jgi:hypothetical protein